MVDGARGYIIMSAFVRGDDGSEAEDSDLEGGSGAGPTSATARRGSSLMVAASQGREMRKAPLRSVTPNARAVAMPSTVPHPHMVSRAMGIRGPSGGRLGSPRRG